MKKIINGKLYNTETAQIVGAHSFGENQSDFQHYEETLFRKRTGEYFLFGKGGPMSKYAFYYGGSWGWGKKILPTSLETARKWAEEHLDADAYQAEFGPVSEDVGRTVLSISMNIATAERIRKEAKVKGMSVSALIASKF